MPDTIVIHFSIQYLGFNKVKQIKSFNYPETLDIKMDEIKKIQLVLALFDTDYTKRF